MYLKYFGLSKPPFPVTPDTHVFFEERRGPTLEALIYAIRNGEGIIKVVGEVGTGKTMLCRMLPTKVPGDIDWVYLAHPNLSPDQTLKSSSRAANSLGNYPVSGHETTSSCCSKGMQITAELSYSLRSTKCRWKRWKNSGCSVILKPMSTSC